MITSQKLYGRSYCDPENFIPEVLAVAIKNGVPLEGNTGEKYFDLIYPFLPNGFIILIRPTSRVCARFNITSA